MTIYSRGDQPFEIAEARQEHREYLDRVRLMDFRRSPHLPRYFALDFFNDGVFRRFEYDPHANSLLLEMESVLALNDVYDLRVRNGLKREMDHNCEDFSYTCLFRGVVALQIRRKPMHIENLAGEVRYALVTGQMEDDYQRGEIVESPLLRELEAQTGLCLFHLRFETGWAKEVDVIFEKAIVRKVNNVRYESYTDGKRVRLTHLFRG